MGKTFKTIDEAVIRFAGDSGDGMQLTGGRFTETTAIVGNDLSTLPDFPAEIRAPQGTIAGVSSFQVQIADFDISTQVCGLNTKQRSCVGTPWYTAPEVILVEPYSYSADIWSLGCTVYQLATGVCPYAKYGAVQAMFQMVNNGCPEYPDNFKPREDLKDFTDNCFVRDPKKRATAVELREHSFLCGNWTANFIIKKLRSFGLEVHSRIGQTGVVGVLNG